MIPSSAGRPSSRAYGAEAAIRNLGLALACVASLAQCAAAEVRILAFGDSLTQGFGLPQDQAFVPQLQAWLAGNGAEDVVLVNGGVSGDTTAGGLARIGWSLSDDVDAVIVALGGNDMLRGFDPGLIRANLGGILAEIDARGLPMMLCGLSAPPNYGEDYARAFEAMFRELAQEHGAIYCPSFLAGMTEGRSLREAMGLMQRDGIHPNAEGVVAIVRHVGPQVLELADAARAASP